MTLAASLIVKNELGRYLVPCIEHLLDFCDQVIVLDDGSSDGTTEWLYQKAEADDRISVQFLARNDGFFEGHEGRKRQALLEFTLGQKPRWVLAIDADEFVADGQQVRRFLDQPRQVGSLQMEEIWGVNWERLKVRQDGGWRPHPVPILWNAALTGRAGRPLRIADRALACGREPDGVRRLAHRARQTKTSVLHFGWANPSERETRYQRYVTADGGRFHQNTHLDSIMWPDERVTTSEMRWPAGLKKWREQIIGAIK